MSFEATRVSIDLRGAVLLRDLLLVAESARAGSRPPDDLRS